MALRLRQGQVWKKGEEFIRIVRLERLEVEYKIFKDFETGVGTHHHTSKKEFCRLLKNSALVEKPAKDEVADIPTAPDAAKSGDPKATE